MTMPFSWMIMGLLALAPLVTYGTMKVREKVIVAAAVKAERAAGVNACNLRVGEIERKQNALIEQAVKEASDAGAAVPDTPEGAALIALCKQSASCRSRGSL